MPRRATIPKKGLLGKLNGSLDTHEGLGGIKRRKKGLLDAAAKCALRFVGPVGSTDQLSSLGWPPYFRYDAKLGTDGYTISLIASRRGRYSVQSRNGNKVDLTCSAPIYMLTGAVDRVLYIYKDRLMLSRPDNLRDARTGQLIPIPHKMQDNIS